MSEKNIYQRIHAVMEEIKYIKKDTQISGGGANYAAVSHDNVIAEVRELFVQNGILVYPEQTKSEILTPRDVNAKVPVKMMLYSGDYIVHFANIDNPTDRISVSINAHANDNGDKAPGKAVTYATKTAILKVLLLETGINDESRTFEAIGFSEEQKDIFDDFLGKIGTPEEDAMGFVAWQRTVGEEIMAGLHQSFEKGQVSMGKANVKLLTNKGWDQYKQYQAIVSTALDTGDNNDAMEILEWSRDEKRILGGLLSKEEKEHLAGL